MRFHAVLLVVFLLAGTVLFFLNPGIVTEEKTVQLPGGNAVTGPLLAAVLVISAGLMLLTLIWGAIGESIASSSRRRLESRIVQRERETVEMKSRSYDEVSQKLDAIRREINTRIDALTNLVEEQTREVAGHR